MRTKERCGRWRASTANSWPKISSRDPCGHARGRHGDAAPPQGCQGRARARPTVPGLALRCSNTQALVAGCARRYIASRPAGITVIPSELHTPNREKRMSKAKHIAAVLIAAYLAGIGAV